MFNMWGQLPEHAPVTRGVFCGGLLWMPMGRELRVKRAGSTLYAPPDPATGGGIKPMGRELRVKRAGSTPYAPPDPWRHRGTVCMEVARVSAQAVGDGCDVGTAPRTRA